MAAPFVFIGTHRIKPGKREAFQRYFADFCSDVVEPQESRLLSFYGYTAPDSDLITVVQVHPDAESMLTHMAVGKEHFAAAYAEYLEPDSTIQVYGTPNPEVLQTMAALAQVDADADSRSSFASPSPASTDSSDADQRSHWLARPGRRGHVISPLG